MKSTADKVDIYGSRTTNNFIDIYPNSLTGLFLGRHRYGRPHNFLIDAEDDDDDDADEPLSSFFFHVFFF